MIVNFIKRNTKRFDNLQAGAFYWFPDGSLYFSPDGSGCVELDNILDENEKNEIKNAINDKADRIELSNKVDINVFDNVIGDIIWRINSLTGGVDLKELDERVNDIESMCSSLSSEISRVESEIPSLDGYATESWVGNQGYIKEHQDITGKADRSYVDSEIERLHNEIDNITGGSDFLNVVDELNMKMDSVERNLDASVVDLHLKIDENSGLLLSKSDVSYVDGEISRIEDNCDELAVKIDGIRDDMNNVRFKWRKVQKN